MAPSRVPSSDTLSIEYPSGRGASPN